MKRITICLTFVFIMFLASICYAVPDDIDMFGGWTGLQSNSPQYETSTATSSGDWTITDTSKSWAVDVLEHRILQADTNNEAYWLIKSNTSDTITVYGSSVGGNAEECHRTVAQYNNGTESYAVLGKWRTEKIENRWWIIDPLDNVFWLKCANNFYLGTNNNIQGVSFENKNLGWYLDDKYGSMANDNNHLDRRMDDLKDIGFNCTGEMVSYYGVPGNEYNPIDLANKIPAIMQFLVTRFNYTNTGKPGGYPDPYDTDFIGETQTDLENGSAGAASATDDFRAWEVSYWNADGRHLTPYEQPDLRIAANPWIIGFDLDNEPTGMTSENGTNHIGYTIFKTAYTNEVKIAMVNQLRAEYTGGSEAAFIANIGYGGSDEITVMGSWSGVTGYVDAAADTTALGNLNTAWGTSFANWAAVGDEDGTVLNTKITGNDAKCLASDPAQVKTDIDTLTTNWSRKLHSGLDTAIFANMLYGTKLNFGIGFHGWVGDWNEADPSNSYLPTRKAIVLGVQSADGNTNYVDVIGYGDSWHGIRNLATDDVVHPSLVSRYDDIYDTLGMPVWHESCWLTGEADSALGYRGTLTSVDDGSNYLVDTTADFNGDTGWTDPWNILNGYWIYKTPNTGTPEIYYQIDQGSGVPQDDTLYIYRTWAHDNRWDGTPDLEPTWSAGDSYEIFHIDFGNVGDTGWDTVYFPRTQEERANQIVKGIKEWQDLRSSGDYYDVGFSWWSFWDYGFDTTTNQEIRNFGLFTVKDNLYDGSEATLTGADGVTGTEDDERDNYGDVVSGLRVGLEGIYQSSLQQKRSNGVSFSGVNFN